MADTPISKGLGTALRRALERFRRRFAVSPRSINRLVNAVLLFAVSLVSAFILSPGLYGQQVPALSPDDVGKPFVGTSRAGFKAARDYELPNAALTEQHRQEARSAIRPVYDFSPSVLSEIRQSVRDAFAAMREAIARESKTTSRRSEEISSGARKAKKPDEALEDELLAAKLRSDLRNFQERILPIEEQDLLALVSARFSREAEQAALVLLERGYATYVVASRDDLSFSGAQSISIRDLSSNAERLSSVAPPAVLDVQEAKAEIERFVSGAGTVLIPDKPPGIRQALFRLAKRQIRPNLTVNIAETEARRSQAAAAIKEATTQIKKGQKVIADGELVTPAQLNLLKEIRAQTEPVELFQLQVGSAALVALIIAVTYAFHRVSFRRFRPTRKDALLLALLLTGTLVVIRLSVAVSDAIHDRYPRIPAEALYHCIPIAAGAMFVRFALTEELSLFFAIVVSCLAGVMLGGSLEFAVFALIGGLVAASRISRAKDRLGIFKAGVWTGLAGTATILAFVLAQGKGLTQDAAIVAVFAWLAATLAVPATVIALTPLVEFTFGYASDIKLLELANLNHPALKELIVQAPGTYHHSIIIGSLVENAAEAIGANPLLARSCAYYHDIGKGRNPLYFGENQKGENRHDALAPAMSAVIIKRHVTDGIEMARQYRLPRLVADAIPQHHGTRLVGYFYHKALKEQEGKESPQMVDQAVYQYEGPKPQFREAALVMIADAVEAASRAMSDPTPAKLQALVQKLINVIFSEGQLDECDLTLKDLNLIAQSFVHTLEGIYHSRPAYPPGAVSAVWPAIRPVEAPTAAKKSAG